MYSPMATHTLIKPKISLGRTRKPKNSEISINAKSTTSTALRSEQDSAKRFSKANLLHQLSKAKSPFNRQSKEKSTPSTELNSDEDQVTIKSTMGFKRKAFGSHESFLTITPEAKQVLTGGVTDESTLSSAVDQSQVTVSSEVSNTESSKIGTSIQSSDNTAGRSHVESSGVDRIDWAPGAVPAPHPTLIKVTQAPTEVSSVIESEASGDADDSGKSFLIRSIDHLIATHPDLVDELKLIKLAVREQGEDLEAIKSVLQGLVNNEVFEGLDRFHGLEKTIEEKTEQLAAFYERNAQMQAELKAVNTQVKYSNDHLEWLELENQKKAIELEMTHHFLVMQHTEAMRDRRALEESLTTMQSELNAAIRRKANYKMAMLQAAEYNNALKNTYKFYEEFYEDYRSKQQENIPVTQGMPMHPTGGDVKHSDGHGETTKQATDTLRDEYVTANVAGQPVGGFCGAESSAWKENSFKASHSSGDGHKVELRAEHKGEQIGERKKGWRIFRSSASNDVPSDHRASIAQSTAPAVQPPAPAKKVADPGRPISLSDFPTPPSRKV